MADDDNGPMQVVGCLMSVFNGIGIIVCVILYFVLEGTPWWLNTLLVLSPMWMPGLTYGVFICCACSGMLCCGCDVGDSDQKSCPLCSETLKDEEAQEHRITCMESSEYKQDYDDLPVMFPELKCPNCGIANQLKVWPKRKMEKFECQAKKIACEENDLAAQESESQNSSEERSKKIKNSGCNLFKCFPCDYDLCLKCIQTLRGASKCLQGCRSSS